MFGNNNFKSRELYFQVKCPSGWFFVDGVSFLKEYYGLALDEPWPWETKSSSLELTEREALDTIESEKFHTFCVQRIQDSGLDELYELNDNNAPLIPFRPSASFLAEQWNSMEKGEVKPVWQASDFFLQLDGIDFDKLQKEQEMANFIKQVNKGK